MPRLITATLIRRASWGQMFALAKARAKPTPSSSEAIALFLPRIGVVVVAVALPETGLVDGRELDSAQPLGALPEVLAGYDQAERPAVLSRERLPVGVGREQRVLVFERCERHVRG